MVTFYDGFRAVALVAGFAAGVRQRKYAFLADITFTSWVFLLLFLCPKCVAVHMSSADDSLLKYLLQESACWLLGSLMLLHLYGKSRDDSVVGSLLWSRSLGTVPLLMMMLYGQLTYKKLNNSTMWSGWFYFLCLWLSSVYQLVVTRPSVGRREMKGGVSIVCRLYFLMLFFSGLACMAFPKMMLEGGSVPPKSYHIHLMRCIGALIFSLTLPAWYSTSFRRNEDRKNFFASQLLTVGLVTAAQGYYFFVEKSFPMSDLKTFLFADAVLAVFPAVGMYLIYREEKTAVMSRSFYNTRSKKLE